MNELASEFRANFADQQIFPLRKSKKFSYVDILSYVGGLLGLFTGFSFLSAVEIFYIFVIKAFFKKSSKVEPFTPNSTWKVSSIVHFYFEQSSVHSFNYIGKEKRKSEK
jgi:hypothetical protein